MAAFLSVSSKKCLDYFMCMSVLLYGCMCTMCEPAACRVQKRVLVSLELNL